MLSNFGSVRSKISRICWRNNVTDGEFSLRCQKCNEKSPFVQMNYCLKRIEFPLEFAREFSKKIRKDKERNSHISLTLLLHSTVHRTWSFPVVALQRTATKFTMIAIVNRAILLIKPFVWWDSHCHCCHGLLKLPTVILPSMKFHPDSDNIKRICVHVHGE